MAEMASRRDFGEAGPGQPAKMGSESPCRALHGGGSVSFPRLFCGWRLPEKCYEFPFTFPGKCGMLGTLCRLTCGKRTFGGKL